VLCEQDKAVHQLNHQLSRVNIQAHSHAALPAQAHGCQQTRDNAAGTQCAST
jgi:hypothetical protein